MQSPPERLHYVLGTLYSLRLALLSVTASKLEVFSMVLAFWRNGSMASRVMDGYPKNGICSAVTGGLMVGIAATIMSDVEKHVVELI